MNAKMVRFLNSLNIKDIERFDMDLILSLEMNSYMNKSI